MPKNRTTLRFRIPPYEHPRNEWRKKIHAIASHAASTSNIKYDSKKKLELHIRLYIPRASLLAHDVDNRLKDIMDALQGRAGGSKKIHMLKPLIPNDKQIVRIVIEKSEPPPQSHGLGHIIMRQAQKRL